MINYHSLAAPIGWLSIALIFIISGIMKIPAYDGTQAYMQAVGVSGYLLPLTILFEVIVAIMIVIGWKTRLGAIALAGGFLFLIAHGAGAYSLDNYMKNKAQLL
ncbi:hypothetical protein MNBD_ALPHA03-1678 [hydrothermal vent metagenome]|uniref:DoxX family protein n=1 Tax=hydrothermal vent metagenome TaxID=652676 RepID=A0A3B1AJ05_9ZZZZ